jgi:spermidine synthase
MISLDAAENTNSRNPYTMIFLLMLACFFISGTTGLVYEVLWTRMIVEIIGSSPFSVTIVLTVFMAGLGFGSYIAAKTIDRIKRPENIIRLYGFLELGIGLYCLVLPLLLSLFKPIYSILYNRLFAHFFTYNLFTFVGCAVLLIIPVTFMGATLPALSRFFVTTLSKVGTHVGRLYGLNTIGAAAGSLLCGFWLINLLGVWGVLALAIALNAGIGIVCIIISIKQAGKIAVPEELERPLKTAKVSKPSKEKFHSPSVDSVYVRSALIIFAISGFCSMAYEVLWTKLLGLLVGPTTYSFTIVLVTFISGLALGSLFFGWLGDRTKNAITLLLSTQIAAALAALLFSQVIGNSQIFFARLIYIFQDNFARLYFMQGTILFGFMFMTTFCLGAAFPLVGKIFTRSLENTGKSIGYAYAINSIGAVLGSFCAGFILIPFLGKENSIRLVVGIQLAAAFLIWAIIARKQNASMVRRAFIAVPVFIGITLMFYFPRWDHVMLSMGKYHRFDRPEILKMGWMQSLFSWEDLFPDLKSEKLLFYGDGIGGFTTVLESTGLMGDVNYNLCNSGKPDASSTRDMDTQTLLAHFPLLFHAAPKDVLVIGLGSGITAGEILHYPVNRLDIVEINEQVVHASDYFIPWNNHVLTDPRTNLIVQDGRAHLELSEQRYDLITSEPSNPWMAGIAALYTKDFFDLVTAKLKPNGIFVQWIPAYQMDWESFTLIGRTFASAFPKSLMVCTNPARPSSFLFIGIHGDQGLDPEIAARNLAYAEDSKNITLRNSRLFYNLIVSDDLKYLFGKGPINTDNRPLLEYYAPKSMHKTDATIIRKIGAGIDLSLSKNLSAMIRENQANVDRQIDYAEYFLSFRGADSTALQYPVNLAEATAPQKERYSQILENFCSNNLVSDFSRIIDPELQARCFTVQYESVLKRLPGAKNKAPLYAHLGNICLQNHQPEKAVEYYEQEVALTPGDKAAYNNLGIAYDSCEQYDKAIEQFSTALRIDPNYAQAHGNLGVSLASKGRDGLDDAITHYRAALQIDPENADTHNNLGSALMAQGKLNEAVVHLMKALQIRPGFQKAENNLRRAMAARK